MSDARFATAWAARLELDYLRRGGRTVLARRLHCGPLRVQKALYPEGDAVCHTLVLHPPAGIVGGDRLSLTVDLDRDAHALLTTPGATKWYRSAGGCAELDTLLRVGSGARCEWLPQEAIVFDGAIARQRLRVQLARGARFIGLDVLCLGRQAAGETFTHGRFGQFWTVEQEGLPLWQEWGTLHGGAPFLSSPVGLQGQTVSATVLAAGLEDAAGLVKAVRAAVPAGAWTATALPGVVVARWLGMAGEAARAWFVQLWRVLRPALCGLAACAPRIWNT